MSHPDARALGRSGWPSSVPDSLWIIAFDKYRQVLILSRHMADLMRGATQRQLLITLSERAYPLREKRCNPCIVLAIYLDLDILAGSVDGSDKSNVG